MKRIEAQALPSGNVLDSPYRRVGPCLAVAASAVGATTGVDAAAATWPAAAAAPSAPHEGERQKLEPKRSKSHDRRKEG